VSGPRPLVVIGDVLLDRDLIGSSERLCPDAPVPVLDDVIESSRPGGAGLAALLAVRDGREVVLVTAVGDDDAGRLVVSLLQAAGVDVRAGLLAGETPVKVRIRAGGHAVARLDYGGRGGAVRVSDTGMVAGAGAVLVSDYGRGVAACPSVRAALAGAGRRPVVWDPHPCGPPPVTGARLVTPNRAEAGVGADASLGEIAERARWLAEAWEAAGVAVTLGERGALLVEGDGAPLVVPPPAPGGGDPCGAGDRFAAAAAGALAAGALPSEAVAAAVVAASQYVADGGASAIAPHPLHPTPADDAWSRARRVRAAGGTVVATGGCFDLVHAGHVRLLESARTLGDCLIVCLNSDTSVARVKGPGRPLQPAEDRAAVLLALGCVDAVAVFDDDTPARVLTELRPHVFVKGADYTLARLPEADVLAGWGGQAVLLPYLEGRSTTRLVKEAARHG
jgi:rfaE bifunctional protein nucleotidyltransferase chain/domain/rfaE bifunctional protein kinase chain/domain